MNSDTTQNQTEEAAKPKAPQKPKQSPISEFFDYIEIFVFAACAVLLLFTAGIRLCRVDGDSMTDTLENGQMLLVSDPFYTPETGDIVIFHQSNNAINGLNKPLVKRVIATEGQWYRLVYSDEHTEGGKNYVRMTVYVSDDENFDESEILDESYIDFVAASSRGNPYAAGYYAKCTVNNDGTREMSGEVPEGKIFVMGDNRYNSNDSRLQVGYVDARCVLGKVRFRVTPPGSVY